MDRVGMEAIRAIVTKPRPEFKSITVRQLTPVIGAEISGVDISSQLSELQCSEIYQAFLEYHVLVFRDQIMTREQQKAFGRMYGTLRALPLEEIDGDDPEIVLLQASQESSFVAGESWHTDGTATKEPAFAQMLYLTKMPESGCGGDTMFANMHLAYEMLSPGMKKMLEGMTAIHDGAVPWAGYEAPPNLSKSEHPVVAHHPETGKKMLFVNPGFTTHIPQLTDFESRAILDMLFSLVDKEHALSCRVRWEQNTAVLWDNRCTQHRAIWDYFPNGRYAERITLLGKPVVG